MAHNATSGSYTFFAQDTSLNSYPTSGLAPGNVLLVSANTSTAPTPVTAANGLYVQPGTSTTWAVSAASLPLPSGAATAANQSTANTALGAIQTAVEAIQAGQLPDSHAVTIDNASIAVTGTFWQATQPVSAASLPLPTGAATSDLQGTANTALANIETAVEAIQAAQLPDSHNVTVDNASIAVTGTFWQATQPVSLASVPSHAVTNAGTFAVQAEQSGAWNVTTVTTVSAVTAITNALPAGDNNIGNVDIASALPAGTNNIGDVDVLSLPAIPAGTNLIGRASASPETSTVYNGTTALTPKFAAISASSSGNNTIIAAVTGKKIRVLAYNFIGNGAVNAKFQSGAGGTDLTGLKYIAAAGGGICAPMCGTGWFETASDALLNLNLSGAVAVGGELVYVEV